MDFPLDRLGQNASGDLFRAALLNLGAATNKAVHGIDGWVSTSTTYTGVEHGVEALAASLSAIGVTYDRDAHLPALTDYLVTMASALSRLLRSGEVAFEEVAS